MPGDVIFTERPAHALDGIDPCRADGDYFRNQRVVVRAARCSPYKRANRFERRARRARNKNLSGLATAENLSPDPRR